MLLGTPCGKTLSYFPELFAEFDDDGVDDDGVDDAEVNGDAE